MGVANIGSIENGIRLMLKINPSSILDVGVGFGTWGFLARAYLDLWRHRTWKGVYSPWRVRLDGVEAYQPFTCSVVTRELYDALYAETAAQFFRRCPKCCYDLIILSEVLEHMPKDEGKFVLSSALECGGSVMISLPIDSGVSSPKPDSPNPYVGHCSQWKDDISALKARAAAVFDGGPNNVLLWLKGEKYEERTPPGWVDQFRF